MKKTAWLFSLMPPVLSLIIIRTYLGYFNNGSLFTENLSATGIFNYVFVFMVLTTTGVGLIFFLPSLIFCLSLPKNVKTIHNYRDIKGRISLAALERYTQTSDADAVVVMVTTPAQLTALIEEALPSVSGQHWIMMSTVGPKAIIAAAEQLQRQGAYVVDAPVTGGIARARTGELVIFAADDQRSLNHVAPVLRTIGRMKTVGNRPGDGQGIKVINQHLCAIHIVAAAEALNLAQSLGLGPAQVLHLVEGGAAGSWMLSDRGPRMLQGTDVEVSSAINIFVKDSSLVADAATACAAEVPLLREAHAR